MVIPLFYYSLVCYINIGDNMSELNNTRKAIEKDMTKSVIKLLVVLIIMAIIFCGILFYFNTRLGLIGLVFAIIFISPVIIKLLSIKRNKNVKYLDSNDNK